MLKAKFEQSAELLPSVSAEEVDKYDAYFAILKEWNEKINLVSRKSIDSSFEYHFADSVHLAEFTHKNSGGRALRDLGTGAGFPGLVYAIRYPQTRVILYEKMAKRRAFLADVLARMRFKNVILEGALPEKRFGEIFTARAVLPPPELFLFMKSRLDSGGRLVVSVGGSTDIGRVPGAYKSIAETTYTLPGDAGSRKAAVFEFVPRETNG